MMIERVPFGRRRESEMGGEEERIRVGNMAQMNYANVWKCHNIAHYCV